MTLKGIFSWQGLDNTNDLNALNAKIVDRGIFDGGSIDLSGVSLQVSINPFVAVSYDGMVVQNDAVIAVSVPAGATNYLVCFAKWIHGSAPTIEIQLVNHVTWTTSINKNYFITFAKITVPGGATSIDPSYMDWSVSDYADKGGKIGWRPRSASFAALPTTGNKVDDVRVGGQKLYYWDQGTLTWKILAGKEAGDIAVTPSGILTATNLQGTVNQTAAALASLLATDTQVKNIPFVFSGECVAPPGMGFYFYTINFPSPFFVVSPSVVDGGPGSGTGTPAPGIETNINVVFDIIVMPNYMIIAVLPLAVGGFIVDRMFTLTVP